MSFLEKAFSLYLYTYLYIHIYIYIYLHIYIYSQLVVDRSGPQVTRPLEAAEGAFWMRSPRDPSQACDHLFLHLFRKAHQEFKTAQVSKGASEQNPNPKPETLNQPQQPQLQPQPQPQPNPKSRGKVPGPLGLGPWAQGPSHFASTPWIGLWLWLRL